jgi:hypothetical protein
MTGALGRLRARVGEEEGMVTAFVVVFTSTFALSQLRVDTVSSSS